MRLGGDSGGGGGFVCDALNYGGGVCGVCGVLLRSCRAAPARVASAAALASFSSSTSKVASERAEAANTIPSDARARAHRSRLPRRAELTVCRFHAPSICITVVLRATLYFFID